MLFDGNMFSRKVITQRNKSLSLLLVCLAAVCSPLLAAAQNSPVTSKTSAEPKVVQQCGYVLKPRPISFQPDPAMNFAFSIERDDQTEFRALQQDSIEAFHDGDKLRLNPDALQNRANKPVAAMILVDVSQSMLNPKFRKLDAVKVALHGFIRGKQLGPEDRIAIFEFDKTLRMVQQATTSRSSLHEAVDRLGGKGGTMLYDAIMKSLRQANRDGVQNLVVLSDGVDSSPEAVYYRPHQPDKLRDFEHVWEQKIINLSKEQRPGVRIFAIEMGNTSDADRSMYVYRDSLANISRATGGREDYIDLVELRQHQNYDKRLGEELSTRLEQIRQTFTYDYLLTLPLAGRVQPDGQPHVVAINFKLDRCVLRYETKYVWYPGKSAPEVLSTTGVFIAPVPMPEGRSEGFAEISGIYLIILAVLGLLSVVPVAAQRFAQARESREIRRAIIKVERASPYIGKECPSERGFRRFREGDILLICPDPNCRLPHHLDCWHQAQGRCYRRNCSFSSNPRPLPEALVKGLKLLPRS